MSIFSKDSPIWPLAILAVIGVLSGKGLHREMSKDRPRRVGT